MSDEKPETPKPTRISVLADARARLTKSREAPFKLVEFEGCEYAIKLPTVGEKGRIAAMALSFGADERARFDAEKQKVAALLLCLHCVNEQGKPGARIFEDTDYDTLAERPSDAGDMVNVLGQACVDFIRENATTKESAKNG